MTKDINSYDIDLVIIYNDSGRWSTKAQNQEFYTTSRLTHWSRVTHICVGNLTIIGLDNGLSPGRRQAFI